MGTRKNAGKFSNQCYNGNINDQGNSGNKINNIPRVNGNGSN